jgi:hypothetical protein
MMLHLYQLITALIAALVVAVILRERSLSRQITGGVVLVLLLLRLFLIK